MADGSKSLPTENENTTTRLNEHRRKAMTSAEFWGEMLRETRGDDWHKFHDLSEWLHCRASEDHAVITNETDVQDEDHYYCFHIFSDASILDCDTGEVITFEDAVKRIGYSEPTIGALWSALKSGCVVSRRSSLLN
jgi:hypothetical protein